MINKHCVTVTVTVWKLLCINTFLYRCNFCSAVGVKQWITQHLRVAHLREKQQCTSCPAFVTSEMIKKERRPCSLCERA